MHLLLAVHRIIAQSASGYDEMFVLVVIETQRFEVLSGWLFWRSAATMVFMGSADCTLPLQQQHGKSRIAEASL